LGGRRVESDLSRFFLHESSTSYYVLDRKDVSKVEGGRMVEPKGEITWQSDPQNEQDESRVERIMRKENL